MRIPPELLACAQAGRLILAPNAELAAALFDAIERAQRESGREVWPTPNVREFTSWAREQYALRSASDLALPRQLSDIEERELWRQVVEASSASPELLDIGVAARAAGRARRAVFEYAIPWARVAAEAAPETEIFLNWNAAFESRCRDLDCVGTEARLQALAAPTEPIYWIESPAWRPAVRQWLSNRARVISPQAHAASEALLLHAAGPAQELAAIAAWMQEQAAAAPGFRAWIHVPGLAARRAEIADAFDARLAPQRFVLSRDSRSVNYAVAGGTPLAEYAPIRAALNLLQASVGVVGLAQFSSLLLSAELQQSDGDAGAAVLVDLALRRYGPHEAPLGQWLELAEAQIRQRRLAPAAALVRLGDAVRVLDTRLTAARMSQWIGIWTSAFNAAPWGLRQRWSSTEYQAAERFRELLAALAGAEDLFGQQPREAAQRILARSARETAFQPQTGIPPIWISGQLIDPWLHYDTVWVSGLCEAQWPQPVEPIALLPVGLQRAFGVTAADAATQLEASRDLLRRWQQRGRCVLSFCDAADGQPATVSPILPAAQPLTMAHAVPYPHWHAQRAQAPPLLRFVDEIAPPFSPPLERARGVATLRAQSRCPFRGFAEIRLAADPLTLPVPGFNPRERGELVHLALQEIWISLRDSTALKRLCGEAERALLRRAADNSVRTVSRRRDPGVRWQARERERLMYLLKKWLDVERCRAPFRVESLELEAPPARFAGLELQVRIDRVDSLADGSRVLIDYKTGSAATDWRHDRPDNPQLPIYALLLPERLVAVAYARVNAADSCFIAEIERKDVFREGARRSSLEGQQSLAALIQVWSRRIEALAAAFVGGRAEVAPTANACRSCGLQGLCRVPTLLQEPDADA